MTQKIKKMTAEHLNAVMDIWLKTNILAHDFVPTRMWQQNYGLVKELLPGSDLFVYEDEDQIKGFIGITDGSYLAGLFVASEFQSQGIGSLLVSYAKGLYPSLELDVFVKNPKAVKFYLKNDFSITSEQNNPNFNHLEYHMIWKK